ncbi:hypothetical protein [uncultured Psychroserpens sp.]|uniref:hypothetical protein n=1 Tax=uncultured Psychroserpens sp. TaxID=255436 RepID=UPI0026372404|nr:hypothetical protein [uncultured Psychroserpens sp.]
MNKIFYIVLLIILGSCQNNKTKENLKANDNLTIEEKSIVQTFSDVDSLLKIDDGRFWGKGLYGPVIFVEPKTRLFYSNENNSANEFEKIGAIYKDSLPADINIANTAINWYGKRWSMVMLPLPKDQISRNNLIIHELFHRLQPQIGFENLQEIDNGHLDTYDGRLLLKLELQALEKALSTNDSIEILEHIQNALTFRNKRYKSTDIKNAENSLELNEGLAEYTAIMLSARNADEMKTHFSKSKTNFYTNPTFVRSFAYQTIPYYGYLLSSKKSNWHREINSETNLTDYFIKTFNVEIINRQSVENIAKEFDYNFQQIQKEETQREKLRIEKIAILKSQFLEKPTLELQFQNMNISFDPRNIIPLENIGTVYPNLRVTDNWGILTVEKGALLASDWSKVTVTAPTEISDKIVNGDGWKLELNPEWKVQKNGNEFTLGKK